MIENFFILLFCHAIADFALQSDTMAKMKSRKLDIKRGNDCNWKFRDTDYKLTWFYWLSAHSLIHAGIFYLFLNSIMISLIILISHFIIDFIKTQEITNVNQDQLLHFIMILICVFIN